ncbi:hypothetical protein Nepgr_007480 [Nepenthes gracilis]|uniref:Uncharacterized protein n=1 Tax=Nepenthes gracilis TaxID=150966 RepID=A0AAD3XIH3_NEPGR|nr:hypothetical protein Nepgr_007480 [Nepenthes gracilis]
MAGVSRVPASLPFIPYPPSSILNYIPLPKCPLPLQVPLIPFVSKCLPSLPSSHMTPLLSAGKGSALLLDQGYDDSPYLKAAPGPSANSVFSPRFSKPSAEVDSLLELSPKDTLDVNGKPGHAEATDLPTDGGSNPTSLTVAVPIRTFYLVSYSPK